MANRNISYVKEATKCKEKNNKKGSKIRFYIQNSLLQPIALEFCCTKHEQKELPEHVSRDSYNTPVT